MTNVADSGLRVFYELAPMLPITEWWHIFLALLIVILAVAFVVMMYWLDSVELPLPLSILLTVLRVAAIAGVIYYVANLEKRSEQRIVRNSRVALLVDTSLSMGLSDTSSSALGGASRGANISRIDEVVEWLTNSPAVNELRKQHDVVVYRFADEKRAQEIASFERAVETQTQDAAATNADSPGNRSVAAQYNSAVDFFRFAAFVFVLAIALSLSAGMLRIFFKQQSISAWIFAGGTLLLVVSVVLMAVSDLICVPATILQTAGLSEFDPTTLQPIEKPADVDSPGSDPEPDVDWSSLLVASGPATSLSDSLKYVVDREREGPIAAILLVTDGRNNSGSDYQVGLSAARQAVIPVYTIGAGSNQLPRNVRVVDVKAPQRVFPGDKFKLTGLIQSAGFDDAELRVELYSVDEKQTEAETLEAEGKLETPADGTPGSVTFELQQKEEGVRVYKLKVRAPAGDSIEDDNVGSTQIEFIDKKQQVLLIAGGPTRDYRFLRNHLYRDSQFISHVYLQTATAGADQEGDLTLFEFPKTREEWLAYDCIIAFDPDWRLLSSRQAKWLDQWISEKAGGMIVVAGPVNTPEWTRRPRGEETIDVIRRLYPVSFYNQATSVVKLGRFGGEKSFPLEFTREGRAAEALRLAESGSASEDVWADSGGVFGYYAVSEPKAGADVFARFADEQTRIGGELPIYLAGQFYGAGRVFFQASGEMWRMRALEPDYFDQYYTKIIRWVSQGRLSRDSKRGLLLVDREQVWIGDQITVQAILRDAQDRPLSMPAVTAALRLPDGRVETLDLKQVADGADSGTFSTQLSTGIPGKYEITVPIPDSPDGEVLTAEVTATISDQESSQPQRNDAVLSEIAEQTGGQFFVNVKDVPVAGQSDDTLAGMIPPQDQETFLPGTTDREFSRRSMMWLLGIFTLVLCLEWTIRRLNRLA